MSLETVMSAQTGWQAGRLGSAQLFDACVSPSFSLCERVWCTCIEIYAVFGAHATCTTKVTTADNSRSPVSQLVSQLVQSRGGCVYVIVIFQSWVPVAKVAGNSGFRRLSGWVVLGRSLNKLITLFPLSVEGMLPSGRIQEKGL